MGRLSELADAWDDLPSRTGTTPEGPFPGANLDALRAVGARLERRIIPRLSYKPGWSIEVDWHPHPVLHLRRDEVDAYADDGRRIAIDHPHPVPPILTTADEDVLIRWVRECIHRTECHEADEWFTVDGVRRFDPHA